MPTGIYQRQPRVQRVAITCEVCGGVRELLPSFARQRTGKYCSAKCAGVASRTALDAQCGHCQKPIKIRPAASDRKSFCSVACRAAGSRVEGAKWRDPQQIKAYMAEYQRRNRERVNECARAWTRRNPEKKRETNRKRRASGYKPPGLMRKEWRLILEACGPNCLRCGGHNKIEADHVIPLVMGGVSSIDNYQPLCRACNASKRARHIDYRTSEQLVKLKRAIMRANGYEILET